MCWRTRKVFGTAILMAFFVTALLAGYSRRVHAAGDQKEEAAARTPALSTTEKDQVDLAVTVYNSNLALVRDVRQIHLSPGVFPLHFEDVAASINPATVHFRSLSEPAKLSVVEQNYEYDLLDPQKLLQKYVGREVGFEWNGVEMKGLLLADNNGGPIWKVNNQIITGLPVGTFHFPELPDNLYSKPTLVWTLDNRGAAAQRVEASYLTGNMNWNADYVLTVGRDEKTADLDGWVTLVNNSGAAYTNTKLQLVAGEVHLAEPEPAMKSRIYSQLEAVAAGSASQFQQEGLSEYHLYTLERRTSIQNNESKQI